VSWRQLSVMSSLGAFSLNMPRYLASNTITQNEIVSKWQASNVSHKIWSSVRECSLLRLLGPKRHNKCTGPYFPTMFYLFTIITSLNSVAEWLACWTHAQKGPRVQIAVETLSGNSLRQTVHTHCASVHQAAKLVTALLRVAGVTASLAESNGSPPPGL